MRIYQLLHELVARFTPMDDTTKLDLQTGAVSMYDKLKLEAINLGDEIKRIEAVNAENAKYNETLAEDSADKIPMKPIPKLTIKHKAVQLCESVYMRYLFAILFIYLVPKIKQFMNGETSGEEVEEDDEFNEYKDFMRFKKMMR